MARLIIPDDFASQLALLTNIVAKNTALGAASPLTAFLAQQKIVLANDVTAGASAQIHEPTAPCKAGKAKITASCATTVLKLRGNT